MYFIRLFIYHNGNISIYALVRIILFIPAFDQPLLQKKIILGPLDEDLD